MTRRRARYAGERVLPEDEADLALELAPGEVAWAEDVELTGPDRLELVSTVAYLDDEGRVVRSELRESAPVARAPVDRDEDLVLAVGGDRDPDRRRGTRRMVEDAGGRFAGKPGPITGSGRDWWAEAVEAYGGLRRSGCERPTQAAVAERMGGCSDRSLRRGLGSLGRSWGDVVEEGELRSGE